MIELLSDAALGLAGVVCFITLRRGQRRLEQRLTEAERRIEGGHRHIWKLVWVSETGNGHVEQCQVEGCTEWKGRL